CQHFDRRSSSRASLIKFKLPRRQGTYHLKRKGAWRSRLLRRVFKGTKLEVESVLRETCDRVLEDPSVSRNKATLRAVALQILGESYVAIKKDSDGILDEGEYVRVETKSSRDHPRPP
ncbi:hypothetical protein PAXINDRAFT_15571, partial [Paxillus involutus ATCC 200175]